jgi:murein DD-endopeptidase MepM/ murein hydrolase activator NlpD
MKSPVATVVVTVFGGVLVFAAIRHIRQGTVSAMKAPFEGPIFPYALKSKHVSSKFGEKRRTGPHSGIDLRTLFTPIRVTVKNADGDSGSAIAPDLERPDPDGIPGVGLEIRAPFSGTVKKVFSDADGGNQMIVAHSSGLTMGLAHLLAPTMKAGETFKKGDLLALSGNTGIGTGPHVHLTVRDPLTKGLVDPAPFLGL